MLDPEPKSKKPVLKKEKLENPVVNKSKNLVEEQPVIKKIKKHVEEQPVVKKQRIHRVKDDTQLLATDSGIKTLFRKCGSKYNVVRVGVPVISKFKQDRVSSMTIDQILNVIEVAVKSASVNKRKTVLVADLEIGFFCCKTL